MWRHSPHVEGNHQSHHVLPADLWGAVSGSPRPLLGSMIWQNSWVQHMVIHMATIYHSKKLERNQEREKARGTASGRSGTNFQSHTGRAQFPQQGAVTTGVKSLLEKLMETGHPEFSMGTGHAGTSAQQGPRFQTPGGEQVRSITVGANSGSPGDSGSHPEIQVPRCQPMSNPVIWPF